MYIVLTATSGINFTVCVASAIALKEPSEKARTDALAFPRSPIAIAVTAWERGARTLVNDTSGKTHYALEEYETVNNLLDARRLA